MTDVEVSRDVLMGMINKAVEKLESAEREFSGGHFGEVSSRAYYAVFHAISAVLASRGMAFSSHSQTLGAFNREFVKTGVFSKEATKQLQRLFEDRQIADYDWVSTIDEETAQADMEDAQSIVKACTEYLSIQ